LSHVPVWVFVLLGVLIVLGLRRLKMREVPLSVALLPAVAFAGWSLTGASLFAGNVGAAIAVAAWSGGAVIGALSAVFLPDARATRLDGNRVRLPATWMPFTLYMAVFAARFVCGAWASMRPDQANLAVGIGVAISAAMTARLVTSIFYWTPLARVEQTG
jgi:hypothetical protein